LDHHRADRPSRTPHRRRSQLTPRSNGHDLGEHHEASPVRGQFGESCLGVRARPDRYAGPKARKNYAGTSPVTIASGCRSTVNARYVRNTGLIDALMRQAMAAPAGSAGARAYHDRQRARGLPHNAALRHVGNRLVGILHGCQATRSTCDESTALGHHTTAVAA
jgi:hypothetical protein